MTVTIDIDPRPCPTCGVIIRQATGLDGPPLPGHLTICTDCGEVLQFGVGMTTTLVTSEPMRTHPQVTALRAEVVGQRLGLTL